jgi:hypothetical protein
VRIGSVGVVIPLQVDDEAGMSPVADDPIEEVRIVEATLRSMNFFNIQYRRMLQHYIRRILRIFTHGDLPGRLEARLYYLRYRIREAISRWAILQTERKRKGAQPVFIYLENAIQDRYLFQLISFFVYAGCSVFFITHKPKTQFATLEYARTVYTFRTFTIVSDAPPDSTQGILCTDSRHSALLAKNWKKILLLNPDISADRKDHEGALMLPYPMHPIIYKRKQHERLGRYRENERRVTILFSGNYGEGYVHSILPDQFGKISRPEIMALLLASGIAHVVNTREEIDSFVRRGGYKNVFMLVNTNNVYIDQKNWLDALSKSHFFLAPPGDIRPMCHNIIEAMAVGTIPITSYPEWFHPPLMHRKDCLVFTDKTDLLHIIEMALGMDGKDIGEMRRQVITYYDNHLSPESFVNTSESAAGPQLEVFVQTGNRHYLSKVNDTSVIISELSTGFTGHQ